MKLTHDLPSSEGVRNGLKRAKRLVEARFTPIKRFPVVTNYVLMMRITRRPGSRRKVCLTLPSAAMKATSV